MIVTNVNLKNKKPLSLFTVSSQRQSVGKAGVNVNGGGIHKNI